MVENLLKTNVEDEDEGELPHESATNLEAAVNLDDDNDPLDWQLGRNCPELDRGVLEQPEDIYNSYSYEVFSQPIPNAVIVNVSKHFITDQIFDSKDNIVDWCRQVGASINTVVLIERYKVARARLVLCCERGGDYRSHRKKIYEPLLRIDTSKKKSTGTKKSNCPFKLKGVSKGDNKWMVEILCGHHNQQLDHTLQGHTYAGRLKPNEIDIVEDMSKNGINPRKIFSTLKRKNPNNLSNLRHVHNANAKLRKQDFEGRSMLQKPMYLLEQERDEYVHYELKDEKYDVIRSLFWAHRSSSIMLHCFPEVILLDCTYQTNRYKLPFLEIVGSTSTNQTFNIAFCLMENEKELSYIWALEKLHSLFDPCYLPNVICSDRDWACINAIKAVFPRSNRLY